MTSALSLKRTPIETKAFKPKANELAEFEQRLFKSSNGPMPANKFLCTDLAAYPAFVQEHVLPRLQNPDKKKSYLGLGENNTELSAALLASGRFKKAVLAEDFNREYRLNKPLSLERMKRFWDLLKFFSTEEKVRKSSALYHALEAAQQILGVRLLSEPSKKFVAVRGKPDSLSFERYLGEMGEKSARKAVGKSGRKHLVQKFTAEPTHSWEQYLDDGNVVYHAYRGREGREKNDSGFNVYGEFHPEPADVVLLNLSLSPQVLGYACAYLPPSVFSYVRNGGALIVRVGAGDLFAANQPYALPFPSNQKGDEFFGQFAQCILADKPGVLLKHFSIPVQYFVSFPPCGEPGAAYFSMLSALSEGLPSAHAAALGVYLGQHPHLTSGKVIELRRDDHYLVVFNTKN